MFSRTGWIFSEFDRNSLTIQDIYTIKIKTTLIQTGYKGEHIRPFDYYIPDVDVYIYYASHVFEISLALLFQFFKERRRKAGDFLKLIGKVRHAAVMQLIRDFRKI